MATPAPTPNLPAPPPGGAGIGAPGGAPGPPQMGAPAGGSPLAIFAQITQLTQQMSSRFPATSPHAEEIQNQIRMALQKVLQAQGPAEQAVPPI